MTPPEPALAALETFGLTVRAARTVRGAIEVSDKGTTESVRVWPSFEKVDVLIQHDVEAGVPRECRGGIVLAHAAAGRLVTVLVGDADAARELSGAIKELADSGGLGVRAARTRGVTRHIVQGGGEIRVTVVAPACTVHRLRRKVPKNSVLVVCVGSNLLEAAARRVVSALEAVFSLSLVVTHASEPVRLTRGRAVSDPGTGFMFIRE